LIILVLPIAYSRVLDHFGTADRLQQGSWSFWYCRSLTAGFFIILVLPIAYSWVLDHFRTADRLHSVTGSAETTAR